jgi:hypothetical protein
MKRILVLLAIATVGMAASVSAAQAEVTTNDWASVGFAGFVPFANGGAGEIHSGRIEVHNATAGPVFPGGASGWYAAYPTGYQPGSAPAAREAAPQGGASAGPVFPGGASGWYANWSP